MSVPATAEFELVLQFKSELELPRRKEGGYSSEGAVGPGLIGSLVVDLIENVECLAAEVDLGVFPAQTECLMQADVQLGERRRARRIAGSISNWLTRICRQGYRCRAQIPGQ